MASLVRSPTLFNRDSGLSARGEESTTCIRCILEAVLGMKKPVKFGRNIPIVGEPMPRLQRVQKKTDVCTNQMAKIKY